MRFRLVPTDDGFFDLFIASARNVAEQAAHLQKLAAAIDQVDSAHALIVECERRGDELTNQILERLDTTFVTPFDREDIHALAEELDDVADDMLAVSDLLQLVRPRQPLDELGEMTAILVEMTNEAVALMEALEGLKGTKPMLDRLDELESQGDAVYRRTLARLFSGEFDALEVLKWKDIMQALEAALNTLEDVADVVAAIVFKHA